MLGLLASKLKTAQNKLEGLLKRKSVPHAGQDEGVAVKRWKYVLVKPYLDNAIRDLDKWQNLYDPCWYLVMRITSPAIDVELKRGPIATSAEGTAVIKTAITIRSALKGKSPEGLHIFLPGTGLSGAVVQRIPFSSAWHVQRAGSTRWFIIDSVPCVGSGAADVDLATKDIRNLAMKLHCSDVSTFAILRCRGVIRLFNDSSSKPASFEIVFETPNAEKPHTLRSCLASRTAHILTERFDLAKQVAKSVSYVHTLDFVHKNVRPENIIGFNQEERKLGLFYLIGFEQVRRADGRTHLRGDDAWERNIYQHPDRQGPSPEEAYSMRHDIYSLGVCLLEIGLWESFITYGDDGRASSPAPVLGLTLEELHRKKPSFVKDHLLALARRELPQAMGEMYEEIVVNCLTCLDEGNADFGDESEFEDADGVKVGVRYIEKVLLKLNSISV